ncbi:hypothetical protein AVEN_72453-1 [Araneus ventricosus]|uniref:Uncharacterized protein n=1 Tax=Araneus ventricosus TaxID=182803 RepID=A0A4Y2HQK9_ARAVE|nr:hypothetical protein AVEN_72453-1 [Araneus ventricosus]
MYILFVELILRSWSSSVRCCNIRSLYGCRLSSRKRRMALLWPFSICAERRQVNLVKHLVISTSICGDIHSTVAVFGIPDLLASAKENVPLNPFFLDICFATVSWSICVLCIALKVRAA